MDRRDHEPDLPPGFQAIHSAFENGAFESLEEAQAFLDRKVAAYNTAPQDELHGLSPQQMHDLLQGDWESTGPLRLSTDLGEADLQGSVLFDNLRRFLRTMLEAGPVRATSAGNLNRAFVGQMLDQLRWETDYIEDLHRYNKVVNEQDVDPLHVMRVVAGLAGLVTLRKRAFRVTKRGERALTTKGAGDAYARLFRTYFRSFNLAYLTRGPDVPEVQHSISFLLWSLCGMGAAAWTADEIRDRALPPFATEALDASGPHSFMPNLVIGARVLAPMADFGLLDRSDGEPVTDFGMKTTRYRHAALLERFVTFELPDAPPWKRLRVVRAR